MKILFEKYLFYINNFIGFQSSYIYKTLGKILHNEFRKCVFKNKYFSFMASLKEDEKVQNNWHIDLRFTICQL